MPKAREKINWLQFELKNEHKTQAFEELCYHLFCRKFGLSEGVRADYNQTGIETYPVKAKDGNWVGFQAKYFENKLSDTSSVTQIKNSIANAKKHYTDLNKLIIYTHQAFGSKDPEYKKDIELAAKPLVIEWFTQSQFNGTLFCPKYLDLAQLFFGQGQEISFLKKALSVDVLTFLQSTLYLDLEVNDAHGTPVRNTRELIKTCTTPVILLTGAPGSGKSFYMQKLLFALGGLDYATEAGMLGYLSRQNAIPMLLNLRDCYTDSLESILRSRQIDSKIRGKSYPFIYLLDGLDELSDEKAGQVMTHLRALERDPATARIIISCRSGSTNLLKAKVYLSAFTVWAISALSFKHITSYFDARSNVVKRLKLNALLSTNPGLIEDIKDILMLNLLWEAVEHINKDSNITDLLEQRVKLLLNRPEHKKAQDSLNLLEPKDERILGLQQEIAYHFQSKYQFRFPLDDLQQLVIRHFGYTDFHSVNQLISYVSDLFFEHSYSTDTPQSFIYQHRRYQEFFFMQKLKKEYEKDPQILRSTNVVTYSEFFEDLFLPYLRRLYAHENNLTEMLGLNLLNIYLGHDRRWGADNAYYLDAAIFPLAVAEQCDEVFGQLMDDTTIDLKNKLLIDTITVEELRQMLDEWVSDKDAREHREVEQRLKYVYEDVLSRLIRIVALFQQHGKTEYAISLQKQFTRLWKVFEKHQFARVYAKREKFMPLQDPFWASLEPYFYRQLIIEKWPVQEFYQKRILPNYGRMPSPIEELGVDTFGGEDGREKLVKSFFRILLRYQDKELPALIPLFDGYQLLALLQLLSTLEFLPKLVREAALIDSLRDRLVDLKSTLPITSAALMFFKKVQGQTLTEADANSANEQLEKIRENEGRHFSRRKDFEKFAILAFCTDRYSWQEIFEEDNTKARNGYFYESALYSALWGSLIRLLQQTEELPTTLRYHRDYITIFRRYNHDQVLQAERARLWAHLFRWSPERVTSKRKLKDLLMQSDPNFSLLHFHLTLHELDPDTASNILDTTDGQRLDEQLTNADHDFPDHIDHCFQLAIIYSTQNRSRALQYILKAINDGILRHGWRKDPLVSENLVEALEVLYENHWSGQERLRTYAGQAFRLLRKVAAVTDGKVTWRGPYNLVSVLAQHDLKLAVRYKKKLSKGRGYQHTLTTAIIGGMIAIGKPVSRIYKEFDDYKPEYNHEGRLKPAYHAERLQAYLLIAQSPFYTSAERQDAFGHAYQEVQVINEYTGYYMNWQNELGSILTVYRTLASTFGYQDNLPADMASDDRSYEDDLQAGDELATGEFLPALDRVSDPDTLQSLYDRLGDYEELDNLLPWKALLAKTFLLDGNIKRFTKFLERHAFPHFSYGDQADDYVFALAAGLDDIRYQNEIMEYLFEHSGHGGFLQLIKAYGVLGDGEMCIRLYERFVKFCELLVN